jgi:hypothetical protein
MTVSAAWAGCHGGRSRGLAVARRRDGRGGGCSQDWAQPCPWPDLARLGSWPDVGATVAALDLTATTDVVVMERRGKKKRGN